MISIYFVVICCALCWAGTIGFQYNTRLTHISGFTSLAFHTKNRIINNHNSNWKVELFRRYASEPDMINDAIVEGLKAMPSQPIGSNIIGVATMSTDLQNLAVILGAAAYVTYRNRPRGSSRNELLDIRRSSISNANSGVFASSFIPKGTALGTYPGILIKLDKTLKKKSNDEARKRAGRYIWMLTDDLCLDPTNTEGMIDLNLPYFFGLFKVNTILARVNEPPTGTDINVYTAITGIDVTYIAERDINANEELFIDYGNRSDRGRYDDDEVDESSTNQRYSSSQEDERLRISKRMQPVVVNELSSDNNVDQDTPMSGGFLQTQETRQAA